MDGLLEIGDTVLRMADLSLGDVDRITDVALRLHAGESPQALGLPSLAGRTVGTLFLTPSTRTRIGFEVAAHRLGAQTVAVDALRFDQRMCEHESFEDALRVISGMVNLLIIRAPRLIDADLVSKFAACPVINGGDLEEHPSQALIDLATIESLSGPLETRHIALIGDLTMRSAASLLSLFARRRPRVLTLSAPPSRRPVLVPALDYAQWCEREEIEGADVVVALGLAPGTAPDLIDAHTRASYAVDELLMSRLTMDSVVTSPMPVVDEIQAGVRTDPRLRMYEESDLGVAVRTSLLAHVAAQGDVARRRP